MDLYFEMYVIYWFFCGIDVFLNIVVSHDYLFGTFLDFLRNSIYYLIKNNEKKFTTYLFLRASFLQIYTIVLLISNELNLVNETEWIHVCFLSRVTAQY